MRPWVETRATPIHVRQFAYMTRGDGGRESFRVPAWGYFEGFEAILPEPVPTYHHSDTLELSIECRLNGGYPIGAFRVHTLHRSVDVAPR